MIALLKDPLTKTKATRISAILWLENIFNRGGVSHVFVSLIKLTRALSEKSLLSNAKTALGTQRGILFGLT